MFAMVGIFLSFALALSWVAGDREQARLADALQETTYERNTLNEQLEEAKEKAARDTKKLAELTEQINELNKDRERLEATLKRTQKRRAVLLKPQVDALTKKVSEPFQKEIEELERRLRDTEKALIEAQAERDRLEIQIEQMREVERMLHGINIAPREDTAPAVGKEPPKLTKEEIEQLKGKKKEIEEAEKLEKEGPPPPIVNPQPAEGEDVILDEQKPGKGFKNILDRIPLL
jgi:predicted RNase H-like nuclease (RuvC/YqgF family)